MSVLELEKAKAIFNARFNPNHDSQGKFSSTGGHGGAGGGSSGSSGSSESEGSNGGSSGSDNVSGIKYDFKGKDEKFAESRQIIDELASEYNTRLQMVTVGANKAAGDTQISGAVIKLSSSEPSVAVHEFAHSIAMENATKFGLSDDKSFWKDVKKVQRAYRKDTENNPAEWISSYEHGNRSADEFMAEAFTLSKLIQKGKDVPSKYGSGKAIEYANKVLDVVDQYFSKNNQSGKRNKVMSTDFEQRSYSFEIRAEQTEDEVGIVTGRPIVYGSRTNLGLFDEVIERGALDAANLKDVRFLVNHDISKIPLARSRNNNANSTMQLMPDENGLGIRVNLDVKNNSEARNLYSAIKRGDISGMSFMFSVNKDDWENLDTDHPVRHVRSISDVVEVSAVTFPAYESTSISVRNKEALDNAKLALERAKRSQKQTLESESRSELEIAKAKAEFILKVR